MEANNYQAFVIKGLALRARKTQRSMETAHFLLGMSGEVGELINACKHEFLWPDNKGLSGNKTLEEAGDVLWYLTATLSTVGLTLEEAMNHNVAKLTERYVDLDD